MTTVVRLLAVLALTAGLYAALYFGASADPRLQSVIFVPSEDPAFRYHGRPMIGALGAVFTLVIFVLHAIAVRAVMLRGRAYRGRGAWVWPTVVALTVNVLYVAAVHPYFLLTVLPAKAWSAYSAFVASYVLPLDVMYSGWGAARYLPWLVLVHGLIAFGALSVYVRAQKSRPAG